MKATTAICSICGASTPTNPYNPGLIAGDTIIQLCHLGTWPDGFAGHKHCAQNTKHTLQGAPPSLYFDYDRQAWVKAGIYLDCEHPSIMDCQCYGREHAGERAPASSFPGPIRIV